MRFLKSLLSNQGKTLRHLITFFIALITFLIAGISYDLHNLNTIHSDSVTITYYTYLIVSFIFSLALLISQKYPVIIGFLLSCRFVLFLLIAYPLNETLGIEFTLAVGIMIEILSYIRPFYNLLTSVFFIISSTYFQQPENFLFGIQEAETGPQNVSVDNILFYLFYLFLISISLFAIRYLYELFYFERIQKEKLGKDVEKLIKANVGFQHYANLADEIATQKERERITREIHDASGYIYTNLIALTEVAITIGIEHDNKLAETLYQIKRQAQDGLRETRRALRRLRESEEKNIPWVSALFKIAKTFQEITGVEINIELGNTPIANSNVVNLTIYRIIQEALTNAYRHGNASRVNIRFWLQENTINFYIDDNGKGAEKLEKGIGLLGMEERISSLGGKMHIRNIRSGFTIHFEIPLFQKVGVSG